MPEYVPQQRPSWNWRIIAFRLVVLTLLLGTFAYFFVASFLPTSADKAAEARMLGKWGLYLPNSDLTLPPFRIIEFLPHAQIAEYTSELEPLVGSSENVYECTWHVRHGNLVTTLVNPKMVNQRYEEKTPITWIDDDNYVLTLTGVDGTPVRMRYQRWRPSPKSPK